MAELVTLSRSSRPDRHRMPLAAQPMSSGQSVFVKSSAALLPAKRLQGEVHTTTDPPDESPLLFLVEPETWTFSVFLLRKTPRVLQRREDAPLRLRPITLSAQMSRARYPRSRIRTACPQPDT